jgi:predicted dinucleotide-binding enzyme
MIRPAIIVLGLTLCFCATHFSYADQETIAIIGTGDLGDSFGTRLAELGYTVIYGSRTPNSDRVKKLVASTGHGASAASQQEAAQQGDIVFVPISWPAMEIAAKNLGDLSGKIIIDPSAPWTQGDDGYPESMLETSSAEMIQQWNPEAKVVKALATMGSQVIDDPDMAGGIVTIPIASNHRDAKERVARLVVEMGLDPVDFGPLRMARPIEAMAIMYMIPVLQRRTAGWEYYFRRRDRLCEWVRGDWFVSTVDADHLAEIPETQITARECP